MQISGAPATALLLAVGCWLHQMLLAQHWQTWPLDLAHQHGMWQSHHTNVQPGRLEDCMVDLAGRPAASGKLPVHICQFNDDILLTLLPRSSGA